MDEQISNNGYSQDEIRYKATIDLLNHFDNQITAHNRYIFTLLAGLISLFIYFRKIDVSWHYFLLFLVLVIVVIVFWVSHSIRFDLFKLFLTRYARDIEKNIFDNKIGPLVQQEKFFAKPASVDFLDKLFFKLFTKVNGFRHCTLISMFALVITIVIASCYAILIDAGFRFLGN